MRPFFRFALLALGACLATACSHLPDLPHASNVAQPEATPGLAPRERVRLAIDLLDNGDESHAEVELRAALAEQPSNGAAQRLLQQITEDPRTLLTATPRPYTVRQGDSM